jgi:hypothetical protein
MRLLQTPLLAGMAEEDELVGLNMEESERPVDSGGKVAAL